MKKFKRLLTNHIDDLLIFSGLLCILGATFYLNVVAGCYFTGLTLVILGILSTRPHKGR